MSLSIRSVYLPGHGVNGSSDECIQCDRSFDGPTSGRFSVKIFADKNWTVFLMMVRASALSNSHNSVSIHSCRHLGSLRRHIWYDKSVCVENWEFSSFGWNWLIDCISLCLTHTSACILPYIHFPIACACCCDFQIWLQHAHHWYYRSHHTPHQMTLFQSIGRPQNDSQSIDFQIFPIDPTMTFCSRLSFTLFYYTIHSCNLWVLHVWERSTIDWKCIWQLQKVKNFRRFDSALHLLRHWFDISNENWFEWKGKRNDAGAQQQWNLSATNRTHVVLLS